MWRKLCVVALWCSVGLVAMQVNAATVDPRLAKFDVCGRYEIVHINGVNTSLLESQDNLRELAASYGNAHDEHLLVYVLAYNRTNWIIADVQQAYAQLIASYPGIGFRQWLRAVVTGIWPESLPAEAIAEIVGSFGLLLGLDRPIATNDPDLARMMSEIGAFHRSNGRMLIVPHSQGNFYAATIYDQITKNAGPLLTIPVGQIDVVGVAVPGPREMLRGTAHYVTSRLDFVINTVRLLAPTTLPSTANLARTDFLGHSFIDIYLAQEASKSQIIAKMETALSALTSSATPLRGLRHVATYWNCGTSSYPYPPPWRCNFTFPPVIGLSLAEEPVVRYGVAGQVPNVVRSGSTGEIADLARAHAVGCVNLFIEDYRRVKATGDTTYHVIDGCGPGYPWQTPYGLGDAAWEIYSGDSSEFRMSGDTSTYGAPWTSIPSVTTVNADLYPACRRHI